MLKLIKFVSLFSLVLQVGVAYPAAPEARVPDEGNWSKAIQTACVESARRSNSTSKVKNVEDGCVCVSRNLLKLASLEETSQEALEDLEWFKRYYEGKVGKRELQNDPLMLSPFVFQFGNQCAKNPAYVHNFGPGT